MSNGSWTVRVLKRDGSSEDFSVLKLAAVMYKAMQANRGELRDAVSLAQAVGLYLRRRDMRCISSAAVFEMTIKVFNRVRMDKANDALEAHRAWRSAGRRKLVIRQDNGRSTEWDKSWLCSLAAQSWDLMPATARIVAGIVEYDLIGVRAMMVTRSAAIDQMNETVAALGLADAVPVRQFALDR